MTKEEKLLCELVEYFYYLDKNEKSFNWNIGYFKKLKKLLIAFLREYTANNWGWQYK